MITLKDIARLKEAVDMAEEWRGNRLPEEWEEFDKRIAEMRQAIRSALQTRLETANIKAELDRAQATITAYNWQNDKTGWGQ